jgi:hypothetical protein
VLEKGSTPSKPAKKKSGHRDRSPADSDDDRPRKKSSHAPGGSGSRPLGSKSSASSTGASGGNKGARTLGSSKGKRCVSRSLLVPLRYFLSVHLPCYYGVKKGTFDVLPVLIGLRFDDGVCARTRYRRCWLLVVLLFSPPLTFWLSVAAITTFCNRSMGAKGAGSGIGQKSRR